jgi:hypothetical protein
MKYVWILVIAFGMIAEVVAAQYVAPSPPSPAAAAATSDRAPVDRGTRPEPGDVRPGNDAGNSPSAAAGDLVRRDRERRILGLPVDAAVLIGGVIIVLFVIGGLVIPSARRRNRARGGGTYGSPR